MNSSHESSRLRIGCRCSRAGRRRPRPAARGPGAGRTAVMVLARSDRTRDAGATTPRPDPGRAAENTTPPFTNPSGGPPIRGASGASAASSAPRRTAVRRSSGRRRPRIGRPSSGRRTARPVGPEAGLGRRRLAAARAVVVAGSLGVPASGSAAARGRRRRSIRRPGRTGTGPRTGCRRVPAAATDEPRDQEHDADARRSSPRASDTPIGATPGAAGRAPASGDDDHGGPVGDDLGHRPGELGASRSASR